MEEKERFTQSLLWKPLNIEPIIQQSYLLKDSRRLSISSMQAPQSVPA